MPSIEKNIEIIRQNLTNDLHLYLDVLEKMVNINSFTANITGINQLGDFTASIFKSLGFMSEAIPSNNPKFGNHIFLTREGSSNKSMAMISHLDTVFPPEEEIQNNFAWRVDGNRVYGPGTVDIKGGTVMILIVLETLRRYFPEIFSSITWIIALDATEEVLSNDFGKLLNDRLDSNTIAWVTARKGKANFKVLVEGRSAHAGNRHAQGANAIVQMSYTVQQIASLTDYEKLLTFNVGTIHGGSVVNRVPHFAEADVEMRTFSPEYFQEGVNKILALNGSSQVTSQDGFACKVEIKQLDQTDPWPRNTETDRLFEIWKETGQKLNMQIIPEERGGLSDGNLLWKYFPTLDGLGPVGNNAHCSERSPDGSKDQEYVLASSFVPKALLNVLGIVRLSTIQTDTQTGK